MYLAQTLTYSLTGSVPSGASINPSTGAFSWTPTAAQGGQIYTLTVRVTDNGTPNLFAEQQFNVGVAYTWSTLLGPGASRWNLQGWTHTADQVPVDGRERRRH